MAEKWRVTGTYFEACNCDTACPCVFLSRPTEGDCRAIVAWHIDKGKLGEVALDGLNVMMFVHSPGSMVEASDAHRWRALLPGRPRRARREERDFGRARVRRDRGQVEGTDSTLREER